MKDRKLSEKNRKESKHARAKSTARALELEALGVRVASQYAVLGPYDFANIVEAPDNKTIGKVFIELGSRGTMRARTAQKR